VKPKIDYGLYLVTDRTLMNAVNLEQAVEQAVSGGCTLVQLREKEISTKEFYDMACKIRKVCSKYKIPLIINDRVDIALAVDADGVHLGSEDMPIETARKLIGKNKILGASARTLREAVLAESEGADYLGVGAMFPTDTKSDATLVAREELIKISQVCTVPIVVIGGINERTLPYFDEIAIDGLAVVSSVISADDIAKAARNLRRKFAERKVKDKPITFEGIECAVFDLDGTLLPMDMEKFVKLYFSSLCKRCTPVIKIEPDALIKAMWAGTDAMTKNDNSRTNREVFWETAGKVSGADLEKFDDLFTDYYENEFIVPKDATSFTPYAKKSIDFIKKNGGRLIAATNPIFPFVATKRRLEWAGVSPDDFELVTTYENFGCCKPNLKYFEEICKKQDIKPEDSIMIGNDVDEDLCSAKLGFDTYLITDTIVNRDNKDYSDYKNGSFEEFYKDFLKGD